MTQQNDSPIVGSARTSSLAQDDNPASGRVIPLVPTLGDLIDAYMLQYAGRDSTRPHRLAFWAAHLGARPANEITDDDVFHALEALAEAPAKTYKGRDGNGEKIFDDKGRRAPATINKYSSALSAIFVWAISRRRMPKGWVNPCLGVERQHEDNQRVRYLSDAERIRLFAACKASKWPRMYALVLMAVTTGARRGTLLGLRWRDINVKRREAVVGRTKNGSAIALPLTEAVMEELMKFRNANGDVLVFPSRKWPTAKAYEIGRPWDAALKRAKIGDFKFHDLRHTAASYAAQSGASLLEIADMLGHKTMSMVKRYSHLSSESKRKLVERVFSEIR